MDTNSGWTFLQILNHVNLADYTSWLIGGPAEYFCTPENVDHLQQAYRFAIEKNLPISILGGGSNVLVSDAGVDGLVICLKKMSAIESKEWDGKLFIRCLSGTGKSELLKIFLKHKSPAALFLSGLPGDVGGGIVMNAGVAENFSPREFMEFVTEFELLDAQLNIRKVKKSEVTVHYRHTTGWESKDPNRPNVITWVNIEWPLEKDESILQKVRDANRVRLSKQPLDMPSCGSVFKNPDGHKAAQLIDSCGLKGFQIGEAQVSLKHANFIVNLAAATARDTWAVIQHVQKTVFEKTGVQLKTEVIRFGKWT